MVSSFCRERSVEAGEDVRASAATDVAQWLLLEAPGPWGPKVPTGCGLSAQVEACFARFGAKGSGCRVQLIRRQRLEGESGELSLFHARGGELRRQRFAPQALEEWASEVGAELDVSEWELLEEPLYIVCTHGKRDACCAKWGMPVFASLCERLPGRVWQTSHLGGHRFAPTFTQLPSGLSYGRIGLTKLPSLVRTLEAGAIGELSCLRGRSDFSRAQQIACASILELLHADQPLLNSSLRCMGELEGRQLWGYQERRFSVDCQLDTPLRVLGSCTDPQPKLVERWTVRAIEALESSAG